MKKSIKQNILEILLSGLTIAVGIGALAAAFLQRPNYILFTVILLNLCAHILIVTLFLNRRLPREDAPNDILIQHSHAQLEMFNEQEK